MVWWFNSSEAPSGVEGNETQFTGNDDIEIHGFGSIHAGSTWITIDALGALTDRITQWLRDIHRKASEPGIHDIIGELKIECPCLRPRVTPAGSTCVWMDQQDTVVSKASSEEGCRNVKHGGKHGRMWAAGDSHEREKS
ncbi:hypothetical protein EYF80_006703 [Liparis tanakae]|uniref:Uncharacterized protein n=1 Tax=Liparis tanakae TaxID=230148 RepID=A0A4Z2IYY5_9TELE|nr:hypothetical protein EYF80_006703 [Liparis tanakae]